jgi:hypothetical protein
MHGSGQLTVINIQIPCETLREFQKQHGDHHLVIDPGLIDMLTQKFLLITEISGSPPRFLELVGYSLMRFRVELSGTRRVIGGQVIPGPARFLTFWATPKKMIVNAGG